MTDPSSSSSSLRSRSIELPHLPDSPAARRAIETVLENESEALANHSMRSYLFSMIALGQHPGPVSEEDRELIFFAGVLHDMGTTDLLKGEPRFELQGADFAADFLRKEGMTEGRIDKVWEAIALHTTPEIPFRRGTVSSTMALGVFMDFGFGTEAVSDELASAMFERYPRLDLAKSFVGRLVEQVEEIPAKGARFTMAGELHREQLANGMTELEQGVRQARWRG
ncbi:HD domain-containing protein [Arthrobacter zhaoguopingii]|uniref:HD domain-containing protein n=1 Tax=Arthrobacter zhaoguopingii TaxID=2681491 RepID=UPI00135684A0|nr:HD domain-containing protein [Arthrobacter zhaoguopingii]